MADGKNFWMATAAIGTFLGGVAAVLALMPQQSISNPLKDEARSIVGPVEIDAFSDGDIHETKRDLRPISPGGRFQERRTTTPLRSVYVGTPVNSNTARMTECCPSHREMKPASWGFSSFPTHWMVSLLEDEPWPIFDSGKSGKELFRCVGKEGSALLDVRPLKLGSNSSPAPIVAGTWNEQRETAPEFFEIEWAIGTYTLFDASGIEVPDSSGNIRRSIEAGSNSFACFDVVSSDIADYSGSGGFDENGTQEVLPFLMVGFYCAFGFDAERNTFVKVRGLATGQPQKIFASPNDDPEIDRLRNRFNFLITEPGDSQHEPAPNAAPARAGEVTLGSCSPVPTVQSEQSPT